MRAADRQAQAGAALLAGVGGVDLLEALEDALELVLRDAAALVDDRGRAPRRRRAGVDRDGAHRASENLIALPTRLVSVCMMPVRVGDHPARRRRRPRARPAASAASPSS